MVAQVWGASMTLQDEIDNRAKEIHTDSYPMSIGELVNLYRDGELDLRPDFQRYFRWTNKQKSKLIESLLLGIPIPSVFVAQRKDGVWDVVDGLQRLSTIFEFMGILKGEDGKPVAPTMLEPTTDLPSLEGKTWDSDATKNLGAGEPFSQTQRLAIKRTKLLLNIVKKESSPDTTLELFNRLNSLGTPLSSQEQLNCLLILKNRSAFEWATNLSKEESFQRTINITETMQEQRFDVELVWRFVCIRHTPNDKHRKISDMAHFLSTEAIRIASDVSFDYKAEAEIFRCTFRILDESLGENTFRQYDPKKNVFSRSFLISAFEAIALGVAANVEKISVMHEPKKFIEEKVKKLWSAKNFLDNMGSGKTPARRIPHVTPFGIKCFKP